MKKLKIIVENIGGVFVQYYKDDVLITLPEEVTAVTDKNAWHLYMDTSGKVYETYMRVMMRRMMSTKKTRKKRTGKLRIKQ